MFCRNCGTENEDNAKFCRNCGLPIVPAEETVIPEASAQSEDVTEEVENTAEQTQEPTAADGTATDFQSAPEAQQVPPNYGQYAQQGQPYGQPPYGQPPYGQPYQPPKPKTTYTAQAIVSMILGIVSIVCCCSCIPGLGCGIAAICLAVSEKNKGRNNGMVIAGLVCGIVGASISSIYLVLAIISGSFADFFGSLGRGSIEEAFEDIFGNVRFRF